MSLEACRLHKWGVLRSSSFNHVIDGSRDDSGDPMATKMCRRQYWHFQRVPWHKSKPPLRKCTPCDQWRRLPTDGCNKSLIVGGDANVISLPVHTSIQQVEAYMKLETVFNSTRLHQKMTYSDNAHSRLYSTKSSGLHQQYLRCHYSRDDQ